MMPSITFWQVLQILLFMAVVAWFLRTLRMPSKFSQRQELRREQRLERRRREASQSTIASAIEKARQDEEMKS